MTVFVSADAPNELNATFWEACSRGELIVQECQRCGRRFFVPEAICPTCRADEWQWQPGGGGGPTHGTRVVPRSSRADLPPPYVVAAIDLDDGWHMMSNIVGCRPDDVHIGMRVKVAFTEGPDDRRLPRFTPMASRS